MMGTLKQVIGLLTSFSLILAFITSYLRVNRVWIVRHEKSVADSISISSNLIGLIPVTLAMIDLSLSQSWNGAISSILGFILTIFYTLLGIGWWVPNERKKGFFKLLLKSLGQERQHLGDLAKALIIPNGADRIIEVLGRIALIDQTLDDKEKAFIQTFANSWGIKINWNELSQLAEGDETANYVKLRQSIIEYLSTTPSREQVSQLSDVLNRLVNIDGDVSAQEEMIISELCGMFADYVNDSGKNSRYEVNIVPQTDDQIGAISAVLGHAERRSLASGLVFAIGPFFSKQYADMIRDQYRTLGFFSVATEAER
jgi:hypothetical protein